MERSSERSDVPRPVSSHRFATGARDPSRDVVFEEYNDLACGTCGRRSVPSKAGWETRLDASAVSRQRIVRVFHAAGAIHRPAPAGWRRAGPGLASLPGCRPALGCSCPLRRAGLRGPVRPSHRAALHLDAMRVVEQAVADGVGLVGVADDGVPIGHGQLTGVEARSARSSMTSVRSHRSASRSGAIIQSSMASRSSLARRVRSRALSRRGWVKSTASSVAGWRSLSVRSRRGSVDLAVDASPGS